MNRVAEASGLIGWISLAMAVVVAVSVVVVHANLPDRRPRLLSLVAGVAGLLLIAVAAVLAALGGGRGLWLTGLGGVVCLAVDTAIRLQRLEQSIPSTRDPTEISYKTLTAAQDVNRLLLRVNTLLEEVGRAAQASERLSHLVRELDPSAITAPDAAVPDLAALARTPVARGLWGTVVIYTADDDGAPLKSAVVDVLTAFELTLVAEAPVERGSWFQRFWVWARSASTRERLREVELAIKLATLGKAQAEIDHAKAQSVAAMVQAVRDQDKAFLRIGSLIVIKTHGDLAAWTVSELEAADLERHSALLRDPVSALEYLRDLERPPEGEHRKPPHG